MMLLVGTEADEQEHLARSISLPANDNSESVVKAIGRKSQPVRTDIGDQLPIAA